MNVDYSVCNALNFNSHRLHESTVVYDVYCQYGVHFKDQLEDVSEYLSLDPEMKIFGAIGKFHLADHVNSCYLKWTLNFMKEAGHIDGKIMETLWSGMNKVSGAARSMGKAHQQETLDDYMRYSNWKKTVGIGKSLPKPVVDYLVLYNLLVVTLITKLKQSQNGLISTQPAFEQLTKSCIWQRLLVDSWKHDEILAMEERGESLNIFDLNHEKTPTLAQVTLQLCDNKDGSNGSDDVVDWIADEIKAESDQWVFETIFHLLFF